uniref:Unplaced genomic scaffold supercont1.2, whole genome shotgun sequence n=1 Tax=Cryptococcus bacillisporus CA1280 TaxID=1296109 RepID=A0A0D0VR96_CRYGA|nr:hypothetical protein I312_00679 [Cryptococcus bacillisporus CA1280]
MHELDLGVAKILVKYAIEMAQFYGHASKVDRRFAQIANFGRNDIRAFPQQASCLKELTAHDWECLLKNIPVYAYVTPKFHMLGHLTASIRRLRLLDNFTTAFGESEHRRLKRLYNVTNKTRSGTQQLGLRVQEQRAIVQQHRMIHAMPNVQEDLQRDNLGDPSYDEAFQLAMDKRQPEYIGDSMERALSFPELKSIDGLERGNGGSRKQGSFEQQTDKETKMRAIVPRNDSSNCSDYRPLAA